MNLNVLFSILVAFMVAFSNPLNAQCPNPPDCGCTLNVQVDVLPAPGPCGTTGNLILITANSSIGIMPDTLLFHISWGNNPGHTYVVVNSNFLVLQNLPTTQVLVSVSSGSVNFGCSGEAVCVPIGDPFGVYTWANPFNCGSTTTTICASVYGNVGNVTYQWKKVGSNVVLSTEECFEQALPNTVYNVLITDANGCTTTGTILTGEIPTAPTLNSVVTQPTCLALGTVKFTANAGTPGYYIVVKKVGQSGNFATANSSSITLTNLTAGTYTATVYDANNCVATTSVTINPQPSPVQVDTFISGCAGVVLLPWGVTTSQPGIYHYTFTLAGGCDSTITAFVTSVESHDSLAGIENACGSWTSPSGDTTFTDSGWYVQSVTDTATGCPKRIITGIFIEEQTSQTIEIFYCHGTTPSTIFDGQEYNVNTTIYNGCDETAIKFTELPAEEYVQDPDTTICVSPFSAPDTTQQIMAVTTNAFGCVETIHWRNEVRKPTTLQTETKTICEGEQFTWAKNNVTYNTAGSYTCIDSSAACWQWCQLTLLVNNPGLVQGGFSEVCNDPSLAGFHTVPGAEPCDPDTLKFFIFNGPGTVTTTEVTCHADLANMPAQFIGMTSGECPDSMFVDYVLYELPAVNTNESSCDTSLVGKTITTTAYTNDGCPYELNTTYYGLVTPTFTTDTLVCFGAQVEWFGETFTVDSQMVLTHIVELTGGCKEEHKLFVGIKYGSTTEVTQDTCDLTVAGDKFWKVTTSPNGCVDSTLVTLQWVPGFEIDSVKQVCRKVQQGCESIIVFDSLSGCWGWLHISSEYFPETKSEVKYTCDENLAGQTTESWIPAMDSTQCDTIAYLHWVLNQKPEVASKATDNKCHGDANGSVELTVSGGTPSYTYSWGQPWVMGEHPLNLPAGTYTVTVTDANGCTNSTTATVTEPEPITVNASGDDAECDGSGGFLAATANGGTSDYTYLWNNGLAEPYGEANAGTYTVTVTDANGCTNSTTATVWAPTLPTLTISFDSIRCDSNGRVYSNLGVLEPGTQIQWFYNGVQIPGADSTSVVAALPGNYTIIVTNEYGCNATAMVSVPQPYCPRPKLPCELLITPDNASHSIHVVVTPDGFDQSQVQRVDWVVFSPLDPQGSGQAGVSTSADFEVLVQHFNIDPEIWFIQIKNIRIDDQDYEPETGANTKFCVRFH